MTDVFSPKGDPMGEVMDRRVLAVKVGSRLIGSRFPTYVIAEVGINHNGSLEKAKTLIAAAAEAGCDAVKFQKRKLSDLYTREVLENPNRFEEGFRYFIPILQESEFEREEYDELVQYSRSKGLEFLCTAFDEASADFLDPYHLPAYKVASGR
jgi:sialic acid synthase SpsE